MINEVRANKKDRAQALEIAVYERGDIILREGDISPHFFVVLSGSARFVNRGKGIRLIKEQDIFGLESLFLKIPALYTVQAVTACRIAKYGVEALDYLIRENPRMIYIVLTSVLNQSQKTTQLLAESLGSAEADELRLNFFQDGQIVLDGKARDPNFYRLVSTQGGLRVTIDENEFARITRPGDFFSIFDFPAQATVRSIGESVVEKYDPGDLYLITREYPDSAAHIMQKMLELLAAK